MNLLTKIGLLLLVPLVAVDAQPAADPQRLIYQTRDGQVGSGYFREASEDSLRLFSHGEDRAIAFVDLLRVDRLRAARRSVEEMGVVLGFFVGATLSSATPDALNNPDAICVNCRLGYQGASRGTFTVGILGSLLLAGFGHVIDNGQEREKDILESTDFDMDPEVRLRRGRELAEELRHRARSRWSIDFHGGMELRSSFVESADAISAAGYGVRRLGPSVYYGHSLMNRFVDGSTPDPSPHLLWFRRGSLHYRYLPTLDIGITLLNMADPGFAAHRTEPDSGGYTRTLSLSEGVSGVGFLLSGRHFPFATSRAAGGLAITAGLGLGSIGIERIGYLDYRHYDRQKQFGATIFRGDARMPVVALAAVEYYIPLTPLTSLGLFTEWFGTPASTLPGIPALDLPDRSVPLGAITAGLAVGWRF